MDGWIQARRSDPKFQYQNRRVDMGNAPAWYVAEPRRVREEEEAKTFVSHHTFSATEYKKPAEAKKEHSSSDSEGGGKKMKKKRKRKKASGSGSNTSDGSDSGVCWVRDNAFCNAQFISTSHILTRLPMRAERL